jgi:hypothetical protein
MDPLLDNGHTSLAHVRKESENTMEYANEEALVEREQCGPTHGTRACVAGGVVLALLCLIATPGTSEARQVGSHIAVGATVQAFARVQASQPAQLIVANKDTNLGYVDVPGKNNPAGTQLTVTTNDRAGYSLVFQVAPNMQQLFTSIEVSGLGTSVVLPPTGGKVTLPYTGPSSSFSLTYRFMLAKTSKDGTYVWPLTVLVQPN